MISLIALLFIFAAILAEKNGRPRLAKIIGVIGLVALFVANWQAVLFWSRTFGVCG